MRKCRTNDADCLHAYCWFGVSKVWFYLPETEVKFCEIFAKFFIYLLNFNFFRGVYITIHDNKVDHIYQILANWPEENIKVSFL